MRQNNREATVMLQTYLRQLSYHDSDIPPIVIDGIFDSQTRDALRAFQKKYGLNPTGRLDLATNDLLYEKYLLSLATYQIPMPLDIFPIYPDTYYYSIGSAGFEVGVIQHILTELSSIYDFDIMEHDGIYSQNTADAVAGFQEKNGIFPTGRVDRMTWNMLAEQMNRKSANYFDL